MNLSVKLLLVVVGIVLSVVGVFTENWKLACIGNSVALVGLLFA